MAEANLSTTETINDDTEEFASSEVTSDAERKKRSVIYGYFIVHKEDTCR